MEEIIHEYTTCPRCSRSKGAYLYENPPIREIRCFRCGFHTIVRIGYRGSK